MNVNLFCKAMLFSVAAVALSGGTVQAANGSIDRDGRVVYIDGDAWRDVCRVSIADGEVLIDLTVFDQAGNEDDHDDRDYDLDDIDLIVFRGGAGDDLFDNRTTIPCRAYGGSGQDWLSGGEGDDDLFGGSDDDVLLGYGGDDDLYGDGGFDVLWGGADRDYLKAGTGEDESMILGGVDRDTMAVPVTYNWATRRYQPVQRSVGVEDFNPMQDVERWFIAPVTYSPIRMRF